MSDERRAAEHPARDAAGDRVAHATRGDRSGDGEHAAHASGGGHDTRAVRDMPVAAMVESVVGCKWSMRLLAALDDGARRPSELLRRFDGLSPKVLNERLAKFQRFDIVSREVIGERAPFEVRYAFTAFGERFAGLIREVRKLQSDVDDAAL